ncbi:alpha/beta hydrolase [Pelagicoccus sp. SDUM812002]|uniref:alpha/beta fold hydrolase n=1 Tax=Pelagicoccus sp. SDUM812002 TaxID=3041266 RepID=UPI00280EA333|nr:alpha/beta hydrolase [Pelagicoccus sp. SDUM812002]MDQ8187561.1 alpha/beta hydrolase [Pelagicoccus sp. SDUM812002]
MNQPIESAPNHSKSKAALLPTPVLSAERAGRARIHSLTLGNPAANRIAFLIHGTPGEASDWQPVWEAVSESENECRIISLDRPGFGLNGSWSAGESWDEQMSCFEDILLPDLKKGRELLVVGHSYGAALALGLAERLAPGGGVSGLVLVSGVLNPAERQSRWYHRLALLPLVSQLVPKRYLQSAKEMTTVRRNLSRLDGVWDRVEFPVTLIHGEKDTLIPSSNSKYINDRLADHQVKLVKVPAGGHDLPQAYPALVSDQIESTFKRISEWKGNFQ